MSKRVTAAIARSVSTELDRIATQIEQDADAYGVPAKVAEDFVARCDLLSDAIERNAGIEPGRVAPAPGDFDPESIGGETEGGKELSETTIVSDNFTQQENHEIKTKIEEGDLSTPEAASKQASVLASELAESARSVIEAAVAVKPWIGFTQEVTRLEELRAEISTMEAEINARTESLLKRKKGLDKEYSTALRKFKSNVPSELAGLGQIVMSRTTKLRVVTARMTVSARARSGKAIQEELDQAILEKLGQDALEFIRATEKGLKEISKTVVRSNPVFEYEDRVRDASTKTAGVFDKLVALREWFTSSWKRMAKLVEVVVKSIEGSAKRLDSSLEAADKMLDALEA